MKRFWLWLARFAYRRCAVPVKRAPVGLPLMRDPDARCNSYEPRLWQMGDFRDCQSDGHYLCRECCHLDPASENAAGLGLN
jgi:hypothetical protein